MTPDLSSSPSTSHPATARAQERDSDLPCVQSLNSTPIFPSWHSVRGPSDRNQSETPPVRVHGRLMPFLESSRVVILFLDVRDGPSKRIRFDSAIHCTLSHVAGRWIPRDSRKLGRLNRSLRSLCGGLSRGALASGEAWPPL